MLERDLSPQAASLGHGAGRRGWAVADRLEVERIDVPGVVLGGTVVVDLEPVAVTRHRLATTRQMDQRSQPPAAVELGAQVAILERDPLAAVGHAPGTRCR